MNNGIINRPTQLHLVVHFYKIFIMKNGPMNVKYTDTQLTLYTDTQLTLYTIHTCPMLDMHRIFRNPATV